MAGPAAVGARVTKLLGVDISGIDPAISAALSEAVLALAQPSVVPDEVRRLCLQPGDRLIVRCTDLIPEQQLEYRDYLQVHFPDNEVLVIVADEIAVEAAS